MWDGLETISPKRQRVDRLGWEGFFPYYAGYTENFALAAINTVGLRPQSTILDPWNGSGTTAFAAAQLGHGAVGIDISPVMVIIARARMLSASEADSLQPLSKEILRNSSRIQRLENDPLNVWFDPTTASIIRGIEKSISRHLVGHDPASISHRNLNQISYMAATFYVALFAVCRELSEPFRTSNPTWLRTPRSGEHLVSAESKAIKNRFLIHIRAMAQALALRQLTQGEAAADAKISVGDSTNLNIPAGSVDLVLTSPPYCTRIDYTAATRIELAVLAGLLEIDPGVLSRKMIGSTKVPLESIEIDENWGPACYDFLRQVRLHASKASSTYYLKTHLDYFEKLSRSISSIVPTLKEDAIAIFVVQDSHYKDVHNDLALILTEICEKKGLSLQKRIDFHSRRSFSGINPHRNTYKKRPGATESVLCFQN